MWSKLAWKSIGGDANLIALEVAKLKALQAHKIKKRYPKCHGRVVVKG